MTYLQILLAVSTTLVLIILFRFLNKGKLYFTSFFNVKKEFITNEEFLKKNIVVALKKSNFRRIKVNNDTFSAMTSLSIWSFSEVITIKIDKINETKFLIDFNSKCFFPLQIVDYNKNKSNCNKFFKNLEKLN